jgi:S-formylglutathione hydrolase
MPRMHRTTLLAVVVFTLVTGGGHAQVAAPPTAGRLVESTVPAPSLKANLLGDPSESKVVVYLPPGYDASPGRRYPTVYLLHGYLGSQQTFARGMQGMQLEMAMDELIRRGVTREMILVAPNGRNAYFGGFYANSPVIGNWEDFISKELVAWVDSRYRTLATAESRGIAGHSMGGYGSIMMAMKHPDVFGAVYALSPCCVGFEADLTSDNPAWHKTLQLTSKDQLTSRPRSMDEFFPTVFVAFSAAFSPNPQNPPFLVDFPYSERDGRLQRNDEAHARWRAKMPLYLVEQYRSNLEKLRGIYLDYGALEEFAHIRITTRALSEELTSRGIAHTFEVYANGDHSNKIRQRFETRVMRFFSEVLAVPATTTSSALPLR